MERLVRLVVPCSAIFVFSIVNNKKVRAFPLQFDSQRNGFVESKKSNKQSIFCDQISTVHINRKTYLPTMYIFFGKTKIDGKYMIMMIIVEKYKWEIEGKVSRPRTLSDNGKPCKVTLPRYVKLATNATV